MEQDIKTQVAQKQQSYGHCCLLEVVFRAVMADGIKLLLKWVFLYFSICLYLMPEGRGVKHACRG